MAFSFDILAETPGQMDLNAPIGEGLFPNVRFRANRRRQTAPMNPRGGSSRVRERASQQMASMG